MSTLAIDAASTGVTARVVAPDGRTVARAHRDLQQLLPQPTWVELAPEEIWKATVEATRDCLGGWDGRTEDLSAIRIAHQGDVVLLWDRETLGSPRRAIAGPDRRAADICRRLGDQGHQARVIELTGLSLDPGRAGPRLRWIAENEPNAWALVRDGRYAVGSVGSYLVARMTRGTWHVTDVADAGRSLLLDAGTGAWSPQLCDLFQVPMDALPEITGDWGEVVRTDPRSFLGLDLPIAPADV